VIGMEETLFAWSCAVDFMMYDSNPIASEANIGSQIEPRVVDRRDALLDIYARRILVHCEADPGRLNAVRAEITKLPGSRGPVQDEMRSDRLQDGSARPPGSATLPPPLSHDTGQLWAVAEELTSAALAMVIEAGAVDDIRARARLLVSTAHTITRDLLGPLRPPEVERQAALKLARSLDMIDRSPNRNDTIPYPASERETRPPNGE
jgi:hypothetical protein